MIPSVDATVMENATVATLGFDVGWLHRTFNGVFPDNTDTIVTSLENVLTVPLQFSIVAYQYANYTFTSSHKFPIPDDMLAVARGGRSVQRLAIQTWTSWLFIATHIAILLFVLVNVVWIMHTPHIRDGLAHLPELEALTTARVTTCNETPWQEADEDELRSLSAMEELASEIKDMSTWEAAKKLKGSRLMATSFPAS